MKKLAIIGATSVMMMTGTAQANFTSSGTNGKVDLTITEECRVTVESKSESFLRSGTVANRHITNLGINPRGVGQDNVSRSSLARARTTTRTGRT